MREPDAYRCDRCGAEYTPEELYDRCHRDDDGNLEFRCSCGCHDYTELYQCMCCHGLYDPYKNKRLRWWKICDDCCGAVVNEFNDALSNISEDYRKILKEIYEIEPIKEV